MGSSPMSLLDIFEFLNFVKKVEKMGHWQTIRELGISWEIHYNRSRPARRELFKEVRIVPLG